MHAGVRSLHLPAAVAAADAFTHPACRLRAPSSRGSPRRGRCPRPRVCLAMFAALPVSSNSFPGTPGRSNRHSPRCNSFHWGPQPGAHTLLRCFTREMFRCRVRPVSRLLPRSPVGVAPASWNLGTGALVDTLSAAALLWLSPAGTPGTAPAHGVLNPRDLSGDRGSSWIVGCVAAIIPSDILGSLGARTAPVRVMRVAGSPFRKAPCRRVACPAPNPCGGNVFERLAGGNRSGHRSLVPGFRRRRAARAGASSVPNRCTAPPPSAGGFRGPFPSGDSRYLVDSASSHMLVSKIKPCMSKYKQLVR